MPLDAPARRLRWAHPHHGLANDPLAVGLINAMWGRPARDIHGNLPANTLTVVPAHDPSGFVPGQASHLTPQMFVAARGGQIVSSSPVTLFAYVRLDTFLEKGVVIELGNTIAGDTGLSLGVGATAPDAVGNNVVGVRAGINYTGSGAPIGTGLHSIAYQADGTTETWFVDGRPQSNGGTGATWNMSGTPAVHLFNQATGGLGISAGLLVGFTAAWARLLTEAEVAAMHRNPFRLARK